MELIRLFTENNIKFIPEKTFNDLKKSYYLRYDFYLEDYNILVEYHGEQHFRGEGKYFHDDTVKNDKIKYDYAKNNNINILYFTFNKYIYEKYGYFTEVITDPDILINKIKEIGLTNQSSNTNN